MENTKIRMILCDVDGTLLEKGNTTISDDVFRAIEYAVSKGTEFVIASGRTYCDLKKLFSNVYDKVTFICGDGSLVIKNGKVIFSSVIDKALIPRFVPLVNSENIVLYSERGASKIEELDTCGNVYKLAFCSLSDSEKQKVRTCAKNTGRLCEVYSDNFWTEFVSQGTNKGKAAEFLQKLSGISTLETAAFGDNTNDFEMLRCACHTFSPSGAIPDIKRMCKYETKNVVNEIMNIL